MRITRHGLKEILSALLLLGSVATVVVLLGQRYCPPCSWFALAPAAVFVWVVSFFRDPERVVPEDPGLLVSPADGVVTHVDEVDEPLFIGGKARRVSIFMSIFNVHVNRAPCAGTVAFLHYRRGQFLNAMVQDSAHLNEANLMGLETGDKRLHRVLVRQVAGLIARRIVCTPALGESLRRGQRFGMIKFSSRVEVFVPAASSLAVRVTVGQTVRAGSTIIGELQ